ncbi:hypothetical protein BJV77DRAFT_302338 [Russula vinacea]|nr:hypothetical protein BJV77DRAFT_302338 [Russula vinacea]
MRNERHGWPCKRIQSILRIFAWLGAKLLSNQPHPFYRIRFFFLATTLVPLHLICSPVPPPQPICMHCWQARQSHMQRLPPDPTRPSSLRSAVVYYPELQNVPRKLNAMVRKPLDCVRNLHYDGWES